MIDQHLYEAAVAENEACRLNKNRNTERSHQLQRALIATELVNQFPAMCGQVRCGISIGPGWVPIVSKLCREITDQVLTPNPGLVIQVEQIKEKFGGLRFYTKAISVNPETNEPYALDEYGIPTLHDDHHAPLHKLRELIYAAEDAADKTCEVCGELGTLHSSKTGYQHTACERHAIL